MHMYRFVNLATKFCSCMLTNKSPNANKLSCGINHCYLVQQRQFLLHVLLSWGPTLHVLHCILHLYCIAPCGHALHCGHCYLARQSEDKQDLQIWCLTPPWHHHHCQHHHSHSTLERHLIHYHPHCSHHQNLHHHFHSTPRQHHFHHRPHRYQ